MNNIFIPNYCDIIPKYRTKGQTSFTFLSKTSAHYPCYNTPKSPSIIGLTSQIFGFGIFPFFHFSGVKLNLMSKANVQLHSKKQNTEQIIILKKNLGKLIHTTKTIRNKWEKMEHKGDWTSRLWYKAMLKIWTKSWEPF